MKKATDDGISDKRIDHLRKKVIRTEENKK